MGLITIPKTLRVPLLAKYPARMGRFRGPYCRMVRLASATSSFTWLPAFMSFRFLVQRWAAWAPGLSSREAWLDWLARPVPVKGDEVPALAQMPAMMRRRIERLGRAALQTAYEALEDAAQPCPAVFASRYGDMRRSIELMRQLAEEGAVSPTAFSVSVHNAFAALFSIARGDRSNYSAVAAGAETAESALVEAVGLLAEGAPEVLVVVYDEPLPPPLEHFSEPGEFIHAWAVRIAPAKGSGIGFSLAQATGEVATTDSALPSDLALLSFLIGHQREYRRDVDGRRWQWERA